MSSVVRKQLMYTYLVLFKLLKLNENMKTIRQIGMALLAIAWGATLTSCSDDNENNNSNNPSQDPIEDFNQGNMNFTEEAGEQAFTFKANASWSVSVAETSGGTTWCTVSPASGEAGEQVVKVKVDANETYDDRSVTLTLKAGTETETFVVTQKQRNALLLTSDKYEVDQKGGTIKVEVKANIDYTATISEICKDWITETTDASRGLTTTTKSYQISANEDGEKREGTIIFSNGTLTETVHVYQAGGNIILLTENEYYADAAGEEITVELRSNCEYEVVMPSVDWIHEAASRAMSSHTLHYTIDPNETYDNRKAIIIYKDKNNSTADTLTIIQAQKDAIVLTEKEYTVSPEGETIEVKLASNTEYTITIASYAQSWITEVEDTKTKALVDSKHYFKIARNNSTSTNRKGTITFSNNKGVRESVSITQEFCQFEIVSDEKIQLENDSQTFEVKLSTNINFDVTTQANWISQNKITKNGKECIVTFSVEENVGSSFRSAELVFTNKNYRIEEAIMVTQQGKLLVVEVKTAGTLKQLIEDIENVTTLKVVGDLNGTDIYVLQRMSKHDSFDANYNTKSKLISLDLSEASIVAGGKGYETSDNEIGNDMFSDSYLRDIILPNNVTKIGYNAFQDCDDLEEITIPNSVTEIKMYAFAGCNNLKRVNIKDLYAWCNIDLFETANPLCCDGNLYLNGELVTDLIIPNGITKIKDSAFYGCSSITKATIPNYVTEIEAAAFRYCGNLTNVIIYNGVTNIGISAFEGCENLTEITLPSSIVEIGSYAFWYCNNLTAIKISDITAWCNINFKDASANPLCYNDGSLYLKDQLINELTIPNEITLIKDYTFYHCSSLTKVSMPETVTKIGVDTFNGCINLKEIDIPNSVKEIGVGAFTDCENLTNLTIGSGIVKIDSKSFKNTPLKNLYIHANTPPEISNDTFVFTIPYAETTLYVPKGCVQAYTDAGWGNYFYNIVEMDK